jgi:RNA polymerase sigma factor (TIGR02999 family)
MIIMTDVTRILNAIEEGDASAADELLPLVYAELRRLAAARLGQEKPGQTLQPTALVHAAYVRLVDVSGEQRWNGRSHFFAAAAEAMRRILIENARQKQSQKRGGNHQRVDLDIAVPDEGPNQIDLLALDEALRELESRWPERAQLVKLRYFAGLTIPEASQAMGVSHATAERYWAFARTWLYARLKGD